MDATHICGLVTVHLVVIIVGIWIAWRIVASRPPDPKALRKAASEQRMRAAAWYMLGSEGKAYLHTKAAEKLERQAEEVEP